MKKTYEEYISDENCLKFADLGFKLIELEYADQIKIDEIKKYLEGKFFLFGSPFSKELLLRIFFEDSERIFDIKLVDTMISRDKVTATYNFYQIIIKE